MGKACILSAYILYRKISKTKQVPAIVEMVMFNWLVERIREKDEWRFATMEYGGQCVTMAGIKWMLLSSANNWVSATNKLCPPTTAILEMGKVQYYSKMSDAIKSIQTYLSV